MLPGITRTPSALLWPTRRNPIAYKASIARIGPSKRGEFSRGSGRPLTPPTLSFQEIRHDLVQQVRANQRVGIHADHDVLRRVVNTHVERVTLARRQAVQHFTGKVLAPRSASRATASVASTETLLTMTACIGLPPYLPAGHPALR